MVTEDDVLYLATKHWVKNSTGISAIDLSEKLSSKHYKIKELLKKLTIRGMGSLKENVELYSVSFNVDLNNPRPAGAERLKSKKIKTHIFFPSKKHLKTYFEKNILEFQSDGRYRNMLRLGGGQIELVYFKLNVLKKYFDHQEKYRVDDNIVAGEIDLKDSYYLSLPQNIAEKESFARIRYGKRKLSNGEYSVSAILCDLSDLPIEEQLYWASNEIENPTFANNDIGFDKFCAQSYYAMWVNHNDPIEEIKEKINEINKLFSPNFLFQYSTNAYVQYPVLNTRKNFVDCCSELYKLIDESSISQDRLIELFSKTNEFSEDDLLDENGIKLTKIKLFNAFVKKILPDNYAFIRGAWVAVRDCRIEGDHKISEPVLSKENYIDEFKILCFNLITAFNYLYYGLKGNI